MDTLTHLDAKGQARMVDIATKGVTQREAKAQASVRMQPKTLELIEKGGHAKGDVLAVARVAAILAAKRTPELIPLCHSLPLSSVEVDFELDPGNHRVLIRSLCRVEGKTGVEMEALTAASVAALTLYDMCKAVDKSMVIEQVLLLSKKGGRSGDWYHPDQGEGPVV